ncbi:MAG TPA: ATP-binding protein [Nitrospirales bacterium]|nr:ATP-binding protein [Nitrospirales bacterium]
MLSSLADARTSSALTPPTGDAVEGPSTASKTGADQARTARWAARRWQWSGMSLQTKVSLVILLIVGASALSGEYIERRYVLEVARQASQDEMMAVVRQIGAGITQPSEFYDRGAREMELYRLIANRPDLIDVALYAVPYERSGAPSLLASAGRTMLPGLERAPTIVQRALITGASLSDPRKAQDHRLRVAAPVWVDGRLVGAAFGEFSTAQFDEVLDYQHHLSLTRRLLTGAALFLAINVFLYWYVHRPVGALVSAVKTVASGETTATVPIRGDDELGTLAAQFNEMVARIRRATSENQRLYDELQHAARGLQVRVEEATAEILQKNRELARSNELLSSAQRDAARAQRLSVIGQLAATVAHKISTPLTALSGHVQLLQEDTDLMPEARRRLTTIEAQIDQTSRIIQDLLIYARKPELMPAPMDMNACVEECIALLRPEMDRHHVTLVAELSADLGKLEADHTQLQEAICNLIDNALDAMPAGGTLTIRTSADEGDGPAARQCIVEIGDTGHGIPRELQDEIFQPFFTTKKPGRGTGLGLAIASDTVRAHGGQITVDSEPGRGSRFTITLPYHREGAA